MVNYKLAYWGLLKPSRPINFTFSVTNICQSRCKTCIIWDLYKKNPEKRKEELSFYEIEKIFLSTGHVYVFNVSGGEPFLRKDFEDIIRAACIHLTPGIIHIPTNGIAADLVEKKIKKILDVIKKYSPGTKLTIKPSMDHIGEKHDKIRGIPGNFEKVIQLFNQLKKLQVHHPNLHVELGTVISRWNVDDIQEIAGFITDLGVDSYRNEIAEERSEMFNFKNAITPAPDKYEKAIAFFVAQLKTNMKHKNKFQKITNAFRLVYYDLAIKIMKRKKQVIPCYAGISNVHLNPYGDIWACCTLGYDNSMGNLRDFDYDFKKLWESEKALAVRSFIKDKKCFCPLANQTYSNMLLDPPSLIKVIKNIIS